MSDDDVIQRVRDGYEAFSRGDYDRAVGFFHPDIEYIPAGGQTPIRGTEEIRAWMEPSAFARQVVEPREVIVNGDKALIRTHAAIRGAGSGIEMELENWTVMTRNEDGLVTRMEAFFIHEEAEARAAAGLGGGGSG